MPAVRCALPAATLAAPARGDPNHSFRRSPQVTGASWLAFGLADLYYARTGVARCGGASAAVNFSLGAYLLYKAR